MLYYYYLLLAFSVIFSCNSLNIFGPNCVLPSLICPNENITFWLYTRQNAHAPVEIKAKDLIDSTPWVKGAPIKILIHGYTGHKDFAPNTEIRPAYLECCDYNIISVDYNKIALEPCYLHAAANTELVGMCTAQLIDGLVSQGVPLEDFHVVGFSLGAQTAGFIAKYLKSGLLERITALDPALPLFVTTDPGKKVDSSDAKFVDILHTNALERGKFETSGHVDFFANGGLWQPGCTANENYTKSGCYHARAPQYYAESIISDIGFYATKCSSWLSHMIGWCKLTNSGEEVIFGEHVPTNATGIYFFDTNSEAPFARGPSNKTVEENEVMTGVLSAISSLFSG
ncbi:lipase member H-A-like [Colias croceus]|uniref:lipase member H-A-like n=1 Tax=Colias crocea TaxID=72248 RepID=UPI001E281063|nr:lipase member H-A-like [Colias croceus]